jgi:hypothetical protein
MLEPTYTHLDCSLASTGGPSPARPRARQCRLIPFPAIVAPLRPPEVALRWRTHLTSNILEHANVTH